MYFIEIFGNLENNTFNSRGITKAQKSRNTFIALAITFTVVFIAFIVGIVALVIKSRRKAVDVETVAAPTEQSDKPRWFMVDSDKKHWWSVDLASRPSTAKELQTHPDGMRTERLKAALNKMSGRSGKALLPLHADKLASLPTESIPEPSPKYPDILERGHRAPLYLTAQVPAITRTIYEGDKPRSPPKALVTQGLSRAFARHERRGMGPRSPASRRKSWLTKGPQHHPFIPLKDDAHLLPAPKTAAVDAPPLTVSVKFDLAHPRAAPKPPTTAPLPAPPSPPKNKRVPPPLRLMENFERRVRFGLTPSPRTAARLGFSSPRAGRASPAF